MSLLYGRSCIIRSIAIGSVVAITIVGLSAGYAQQIWVGGGGYSRRPRLATTEDFDGSFQFCRGYYESVRFEPSGRGWGTDYPGADNNFSVRLAELARVRVKFGVDRQPHHVVVGLTDPMLNRCPILFMEDVGTVGFSEPEIQALHKYFLKGGFLWVDDFWGSRAWRNWVRELARVLPPNEFPIFDLGSHVTLEAPSSYRRDRDTGPVVSNDDARKRAEKKTFNQRRRGCEPDGARAECARDTTHEAARNEERPAFDVDGTHERRKHRRRQHEPAG